MLEQAKKSVLLLNSQKTEESKKLNTLCTLKDIDFIVSEKDISSKFPEYKEKFIY
jgi:DeoR/GlpR family transcriptional regulator of sugar metabolism